MYWDFTWEEKGAAFYAAFVVIGNDCWDYILKTLQSLADGLAKGPFHLNKLPECYKVG